MHTWDRVDFRHKPMVYPVPDCPRYSLFKDIPLIENSTDQISLSCVMPVGLARHNLKLHYVHSEMSTTTQS